MTTPRFSADSVREKEAPLPQGSDGLRELIEAVPNGMVMVDELGNIVLVNRHTESIFGYRHDELVGRPIESLIPERFRGRPSNLPYRFIASPVPIPLGAARAQLGRRKDGSEFPIDIGLAPLKTTEGAFLISAIVDVSERQQMEAKIRRINEIEVQEFERRHLARELHDEIGQLLSTISIDLRSARKVCGQAAPRLDESIQVVEQAMEQVRELMLDLRPPMLDDLGLIATLRSYADRQTHRAGILLHFVSETTGVRLPVNHATACYRVVQEALTNVVRHARAHEAWIEFRENGTNIRLKLRDDGIGFNPSLIPLGAPDKASFGVIGMRERVELLGGTIQIHSQPGHGTAIDIDLPLAEPDFAHTS
jgi:PAS domain S-box-containing protein